ncbi:hypothetical protein ACGFX4_19995 [Kitasatospora sp. NPDC048365]|uniref:hypothetical protein n=1 Tax=Kitasatospora sp. NPDC048365 TaxID=3364050 RepID=UPI0037230AF7
MAAVVVLTTYSALTSDEQLPAATAPPPAVSASLSPKPMQSYTIPSTWTEPVRWSALPQGSGKAANGRPVGFPATTDGAMGMVLAASSIRMSGTRSLTDEHLALYDAYMPRSDRSPDRELKVRQNAAQAEAGYRKSLELPSTGPLPSGVFVQADMVGFRIIKTTPDEVLAYVVTRLSLRPGELKPESLAYQVGALGVSWRDGDWKFSISSAEHLKEQLGNSPLPAIAAPGDAAFNTLGWTAIRQAS